MLRKRYFDAVAADGAWWIAYRVELGLAGIALCYEELRGASLPRTWWRLSVGRGRGGSRFGSAEGWAEWIPSPPPAPLSMETDELCWRLVGVGGTFSAGPDASPPCAIYAEDLRLNTVPWALGLARLGWGRVVADSLFVTWIVGDGPRPIRFAAVNGDVFEAVTFDGTTLVWPGGELVLGQRLRAISEGDVRVGRSLLVRAVSRLVFGAGAIRQEKASRRCEVRLRGSKVRDVIAIAETVTFEG